jgi:hypothetical protein
LVFPFIIERGTLTNRRFATVGLIRIISPSIKNLTYLEPRTESGWRFWLRGWVNRPWSSISDQLYDFLVSVLLTVLVKWHPLLAPVQSIQRWSCSSMTHRPSRLWQAWHRREPWNWTIEPWCTTPDVLLCSINEDGCQKKARSKFVRFESEF